MRLPVPWRRSATNVIDAEEARRELARSRELEKRAAVVVAKERRIIRENHLGPKFAAALRKEHPA